MHDTDPQLNALLASLEHPGLKSIDLSLNRIRSFLSLIGHPEEKLPPVVHIAGTNGKGSLVAYLAAMGKAAGLRVHTYTSPHLVRFRERIMLNHNLIDNDYLTEKLTYIKSLTAQIPLTFFEATTIAAFLAFAEQEADMLLLETGMGGRLDATNIIDKPVLTAITPVSLDHMQYLGGTLAKIAAEKAGIIKAGVPCVVARQSVEAMSVIERAANKMGAAIWAEDRHWKLERNGKKINYRSDSFTVQIPKPALHGAHQYENAALAIACAELLCKHWQFSKDYIVQGIKQAHWPGRLQRLTHGPLPALLTPRHALWLDGGHNAAAGMVLAKWLEEQQQSCILICGMISGKDTAGFLSAFAGKAQKVLAVPIEGESLSRPAEEIRQAAEAVGLQSERLPSLRHAVEKAVILLPEGGIILIAGSLYLAGLALRENR